MEYPLFSPEDMGAGIHTGCPQFFHPKGAGVLSKMCDICNALGQEVDEKGYIWKIWQGKRYMPEKEMRCEVCDKATTHFFGEGKYECVDCMSREWDEE